MAQYIINTIDNSRHERIYFTPIRTGIIFNSLQEAKTYVKKLAEDYIQCEKQYGRSINLQNTQLGIQAEDLEWKIISLNKFKKEK